MTRALAIADKDISFHFDKCEKSKASARRFLKWLKPESKHSLDSE